MTDAGPSPRDPLADALAELRDELAAAPGEPDDRYWLRVGLTLGLRRPGRAGLLLERLDPEASPATAGREAAPDEGEPADADDGPDGIPVRSMLLARAAVLPFDEPPETAFGWVGRLTAAEIKDLGRVVDEQIASGGPADLARGFGLAWTGGVRLPNPELNALFARFTDLEVAVASVLGGQDLRAIPQQGGFEGISSAIQGWFMPKRSPADGAAAGVFQASGKVGQHGLVAAWNAWAAIRFRELLPPGLFEQLTQPWVTVVGRLPVA